MFCATHVMRDTQCICIEQTYRRARVRVRLFIYTHMLKNTLRMYFVVPTTRSQYQMEHFFCHVAHDCYAFGRNEI